MKHRRDDDDIGLRPSPDYDEEGPSPEDKGHQPAVRKVFAAAGLGVAALLMIIAVALIAFLQVLPAILAAAAAIGLGTSSAAAFKTRIEEWPFPPAPPP